MKQLVLVIFLLMHIPMVFAQMPTHVPGGSEPVDFFESPASVLVYIIIPVIVVVLYVIWRKKNQKEQEAQNKNQKENTGDPKR